MFARKSGEVVSPKWPVKKKICIGSVGVWGEQQGVWGEPAAVKVLGDLRGKRFWYGLVSFIW